MKWYRTTNGPLTTERQIHVEADDGRSGWVSVRHVCGMPQTYGGVWSEMDGTFRDDGSPVERTCLDRYPTIR